MSETKRLRIAIQKSGRLFDDSIALLKACGLRFDLRKDRLLAHCKQQPVDLLRVRDDDIPGLLFDKVVDLGIVGANVLQEEILESDRLNGNAPSTLRELSFGGCRLSLAVANETEYSSLEWFDGKRVATSYPGLVKDFFKRREIAVQTITLAGSVEIAPRAGLADGICDLVSSGATLEANGLREVEEIFQSTALLVEAAGEKPQAQRELIKRICNRVKSVDAARESKYVMLHAPSDKVDEIVALLPGAENPTIVPLAGNGEQVALHALSSESVLWETLEKLKSIGASSILIMPVEKVME